MKVLFSLVGWLCIALGASTAIFAVIAFIDPAGAQLADDGNPFGQSPSRLQIAFLFVFSLMVTSMGAFMVKQKKRR